jgi:hypothetical protein
MDTMTTGRREVGWLYAIDMSRYCLECRPSAGDVRAEHGLARDDERFVVRPISRTWASTERMTCDVCRRELCEVADQL